MLKTRTLSPPTPPFLHLLCKARMLSKHSWNKIHLRVEFTINLHLCIALYCKKKTPSCPQEKLIWLGHGALCCGDANSATWAALPRLCSVQVSLCCSSKDPCCCPCTLLVLQGCLVHGLFVKVQTGKVLSAPCSFPHRFDRGRKTFSVIFYVSVFTYIVNFESFLLRVLSVSQ